MNDTTTRRVLTGLDAANVRTEEGIVLVQRGEALPDNALEGEEERLEGWVPSTATHPASATLPSLGFDVK